MNGPNLNHAMHLTALVLVRLPSLTSNNRTRHPMKHLAFYFLACGLALLFSGCTRPGNQLVGAWSSHDDFSYGDRRCEFFKDGSCFLEPQAQRFSGTWSVLDDGRLKIVVTLGGGPALTIFANVSGDELFLDEGGNVRTAYVREGSPRANEIQASVKKAITERDIQIEAQKRAIAERQAAEARDRERQREAEKLARAQQDERNRVERARKQEAERSLDAAHEAEDHGLYREAVAEYEKAWRLGEPYALNCLAWHYATCKDAKWHDGKKAVEFALQAVKLLPDEITCFGTLAAAYARNGQFDQAIGAQVRALSMGHNVGGEDRLKLYRQRKPYQQK